MNTFDTEVLIVGAGPAGLMAADLLPLRPVLRQILQ